MSSFLRWPKLDRIFNGTLQERYNRKLTSLPGVSKSLKKVQMSGNTFGQKSKCLGLNRDFQANSGGVLSGERFVSLCSPVLKEIGPQNF